jgi:hypothetical protein
MMRPVSLKVGPGDFAFAAGHRLEERIQSPGSLRKCLADRRGKVMGC